MVKSYNFWRGEFLYFVQLGEIFGYGPGFYAHASATKGKEKEESYTFSIK